MTAVTTPDVQPFVRRVEVPNPRERDIQIPDGLDFLNRAALFCQLFRDDRSLPTGLHFVAVPYRLLVYLRGFLLHQLLSGIRVFRRHRLGNLRRLVDHDEALFTHRNYLATRAVT